MVSVFGEQVESVEVAAGHSDGFALFQEKGILPLKIREGLILEASDSHESVLKDVESFIIPYSACLQQFDTGNRTLRDHIFLLHSPYAFVPFGGQQLPSQEGPVPRGLVSQVRSPLVSEPNKTRMNL